MNNNALQALYQVIQTRQVQPQEGSYTCYLFDQGLDKILKKVGEESAETIIAAKNGGKAEVVGETADLLYHLMVLLAQLNIPLSDVEAELEQRSRKIGNLKPMRTTDRNT